MLSVSITKSLSHYTLHIDFKMEKETTILFGPSGSGKTTILQCIAGLIQPDHGHIILDNKSLFAEGMKPIPIHQRNIGYVFQDYALFPHMTVQKNIEYGMKNIEFVQQLMNVLGINHLLKKYPHEVSGGEKQRIAFARALATEPRLLLLDEPFSALDTQTKIECHNELLRLRKLWDIPIIIVTHDIEEAKLLGDRILHLESGKIIDSIKR